MPILEKEPCMFPEDLLEADPDGEVERQWWAFYTKVHQEKSLSRQLSAGRIPFYLPLVKTRTQGRRRTLTSYKPVFPGYVFVFGSNDERAWSLTTNRVSRVLPVPDGHGLRHDLRQLHRLIDSGAPMTVESRLRPGNRVRIRRGPFAGIEGTVIARRGEVRLLVSVDFMEQGASVAIEDYMVEPIG